MSMSKTLRLGTRRSALAWVQSSQVAAALKAAHPGLEVEMIGIETRGDRVLDRALNEMDGKEFFTAGSISVPRVAWISQAFAEIELERPPQWWRGSATGQSARHRLSRPTCRAHSQPARGAHRHILAASAELRPSSLPARAERAANPWSW